MSDSMKRIHDRIEDYIDSCKRFDEKPEDDKCRADSVNSFTEMRNLTKMLKGLLKRVEQANHIFLINADPNLKKWWRENKKNN